MAGAIPLPTIPLLFDASDEADPCEGFASVQALTKKPPRGATKPAGAALHLWTKAGYFAVILDADALRALRMDLAKCDAHLAPVESGAVRA